MEIFKRKENYANPVNTAKRNFFAIGFLYFILGGLFFNTKPTISIVVIISALVVLTAAYLLGKNKIIGVYVGWFFVLFGLTGAILSGAYISILLVIYIGYWNFKAYNALKNNTNSEQKTPQNL